MHLWQVHATGKFFMDFLCQKRITYSVLEKFIKDYGLWTRMVVSVKIDIAFVWAYPCSVSYRLCCRGREG